MNLVLVAGHGFDQCHKPFFGLCFGRKSLRRLNQCVALWRPELENPTRFAAMLFSDAILQY
jgi:hypothetical protein